MALMLWNSRFETGIGIIDTQHKALFKAVNDLADSFKAGTSKTQVKECLDFLGDTALFYNFCANFNTYFSNYAEYISFCSGGSRSNYKIRRS